MKKTLAIIGFTVLGLAVLTVVLLSVLGPSVA